MEKSQVGQWKNIFNQLNSPTIIILFQDNLYLVCGLSCGTPLWINFGLQHYNMVLPFDGISLFIFAALC